MNPRAKDIGGDITATAPRARIGIALQALAFFLVWSGGYARFSSGAWRTGLTAVAALLALSALTPVFISIRHLGRQWSIQARTIREHSLVTTGPYRVVRHPIYLGLGVFLVAVGLALDRWWVLLAASILYVLGATIRIRAEDSLMAKTFGPAFEEYRKRVSAFIPRL
jgi:protein-S-isoprenylcysteine O-methyltransferase Ste14